MSVGQLEKLEFGLRELRRSAGVELHERVDLRAWTSLGVGGIATLVVRCHNTRAVIDALGLAASHGLGWVVLGSGSRIIVSDRGIRVPVLSLTGGLARWEAEFDGIVAGAGANLAQVCRAASRAGLTGLGSFGGDSRSIGGLICAAVDGVAEVGGILDWIDLQGPGSEPKRWQATLNEPVPNPNDMRRRVVTKVRFRLRPSGVVKIKPHVGRSDRSSAMRSTGPVFLDSRDASAADLLAEAGCSKLTVGGVRIGGRKGNELIAGRSVTSTDVLDLCRKARDRVISVTSQELVAALVFVDEDGLDIPL